MAEEASSSSAEDPARRVAATRNRQRWTLAASALGLLLLTSLASGGIFLYSAAVIAALYLLAASLVAVSFLGLATERELEAETLEIGESVGVHLRVRNDKALPALWVLWRDRVDRGLDREGRAAGMRTLPSRASVETAYRLHSLHRGLFRVGPDLVEVAGPFGLVRRFRLGRADFVTVLPRLVPLGEGLPLGQRPLHEIPRRHSLFEDPTRFLGIREYRQGDERRRVHWRATARSQRLQVKLFEPAVLEGVLIALEAQRDAYPGRRDDGPDPVLELAVTTAASVAHLALASGQRAGLLANGGDAAARYAEDWQGGSFQRLEEALAATPDQHRKVGFRPLEVPAGKGPLQLERLRTALARLEVAPGPGLAEVLAIDLPRIPRSLILVAVTPRVTLELVETLAMLRRSGIEAAVFRVGEEVGEEVALPPAVPFVPVASEAALEGLRGLRL